MTAKLKRMRTVDAFMTGLKVELKSKPGTWVYRWAKNQALRCSTNPSAGNLVRYTHFKPTTLTF